jgi:hypothetical protein
MFLDIATKKEKGPQHPGKEPQSQEILSWRPEKPPLDELIAGSFPRRHRSVSLLEDDFS